MGEPEALEILRSIVGLDLDDERLRELLAASRAIRGEIARLRDLDLSEVHPAVVFDPLIGSSRRRPR